MLIMGSDLWRRPSTVFAGEVGAGRRRQGLTLDDLPEPGGLAVGARLHQASWGWPEGG